MAAMENPLVESATLMSDGTVTLPLEIRERLGLAKGGKVVLVWDHDRVVMMNPAKYALGLLGRSLQGKAQAAGLSSEADVVGLVKLARGSKRPR
jgi:antitoxin PrlF